MNKQELIDELKRISLEKQHKALTHPESKNYYEGMVMAYSQVVHMVNTVLKLDEPKKPVVPKFVAEWIEYAKKKGDSLAISFKPWNLYGVEYSKVDRWIEDNQETFARAWLDGYEVEKEPLYTVTINLDLKYHLVVDEGDGNDEIITTLTTTDGVFGYRYFLTEKEIKSADENLWKFAVPVEEVVER
ncbi:MULTISPECIES: DUF1642 domain-containing protein [Enterococcus]|uniref:DUF1642 domain-containing protein n=1 Tax=Enterococcus TaxID=1350 RepID=UPI000A346AFE|nr:MULTISPECIES: DUF1642 domain-containing protein [Enterococcus]MDA5326845.1 DUF1642 domain-containing protein [Enterococcus lactis]OTO89313.1 hypothetical protein A5849_001223 [Enterococcus sp. 10F3_DIV0382]